MDVLKGYFVTMPDGSKWRVPLLVIARDRAKSYAPEFGNDVIRSLKEDTLPLFESDPGECADWAKNNMNWDDVKDKAVQVSPSESLDYQEGWVNGEWEIQ